MRKPPSVEIGQSEKLEDDLSEERSNHKTLYENKTEIEIEIDSKGSSLLI